MDSIGTGRAAVVAAALVPLAFGQSPSPVDLVERFKTTAAFYRQLDVAKEMVRRGDRTVLGGLEPFLTHEDRHIRGNAAYVFARFGDPRGFDVILAILKDRSPRPIAQGFSAVPSPRAQIFADRYYAVHLFGEIKDPRAVPILIPLFDDDDVNYKLPWVFGEIGDRSAIPALERTLGHVDPSLRVFSIQALVKLGATESISRIRTLLADHARSRLGDPITVAEAARAAIASLEGR